MAEFVKFKQFSGDDDQDIVGWRKSLSINLKFLAWPQQRCTDLIPTLLTDKALKYYESLSTEKQADLNKLLQALEDKFSPTRNGTLYIAALQERNQHQYESVADYTKAMNKMFQKLQINDDFNTMITYIRGLVPELRSEVMKQRPKSLEDAQELALVIEASNKQSNNLNEAVERAVTLYLSKFTTAVSNPSAYVLLPATALQPNAPFCSRCKGKHSFGQHIQQINFRQNQSGRPTFSHPSRQTGRTSFNQRPLRPSNPNNTQQRRYNPHKQQRTQNNTPIHTTRPNIVCYNCNQTGYKARECRQQSQIRETVEIHDAGTTIMPKFPTYEGGYVRCKALIDSGASISEMQQNTLQNILRQECIKGTKVKIHHKELAALFQGKAEIKLCYRFKIVFQKTPIEIDFHIINDFGIPEGYDLILGRDFLNKTGAIHDFSTRKLFLYHPKKHIQRQEYVTQIEQNPVCTFAQPAPLDKNLKSMKSSNSKTIMHSNKENNERKRTTENLTETEAQPLRTLLQENELAFVKSDNTIGFCTLMPFKRQLKNRKMTPTRNTRNRTRYTSN